MTLSLIRRSILFLLFTFPFMALGQIIHSSRIEFPAENNQDVYYPLSVAEKGLMLVKDASLKGRDFSDEWEVVRLDTDLKEQWKRTYKLEDDYELIGYAASRKAYYLLLNDDNFKKDYFRLLIIDLENGEPEEHQILKTFDISLTKFEIIDDQVLIGGDYKNGPVVLHYDPKSRQAKVLANLYGKQSELLAIQLDTTHNVFNLMVEERTFKRNSLVVKTYLANGELLKSVTLESPGKKVFLDGRSTVFKGARQIIAGSFSHSDPRYATGIFTLAMEAGVQQEQTSFYPFGELENFFNYLPLRRAKRVKENEQERIEAGRSPRREYNVYLQNIRYMPGQEGRFFVLAEAYKAENDDSNSNDPFSSPYQVSWNREQDEEKDLKFSHGIILCFDESGKLLWDNVIKIKEVLGKSLDGYVQMMQEGDKGALLYYHDEEIHINTFRENELLESELTAEIEVAYDNASSDDVLDHTVTFKQWYGNHLYISGIQKVRVGRKWGQSRKVFFINKISPAYD